MRIGELAQSTGVSERSLRYYEEQGLLAPARSTAGQRLYTPEDVDLVVRIQHLFAAGFCSRVIQALLPEIIRPEDADQAQLRERFEQARRRLEAEKRDIERELSELQALRVQLGLVPDTHVRDDSGSHEPDRSEPDRSEPDRSEPAQPADRTAEPAPADHRGRRLR